MKKLKSILTVLTLSIALFGSCQNQNDSIKCYNKVELQQILLKLIEGKECKELLNVSIEENKVLNEQKSLYIDENIRLNEKLNDSVNEINKQTKRKRIWRSISLGTSGALILTTILLVK